MSHHPGERLKYMNERTAGLQKQLVYFMNQYTQSWRNRLVTNVRHLDALSPLKVMQRGYSLVYDETEEHLVHSIEQIQPGDLVKVRLKDGRLDCQVWSMEEERNNGGETGN